MPAHDKYTGLNAGMINEGEGQDEGTRQALLAALAPRQTNVVGNLADLQRGGAAVLKDEGSVSDGVEPPPGTTEASIKADAKAAEKVEAAIDAAATAVADAEAPASSSSKK